MIDKPDPQSSVRLYAILARKVSLAVVFRRGPTREVQLNLWNTDTDEFTAGQWLKGRIYERRCDLSPSGTRLIYFAANFKPPYRSWTAISKPPFLTAVALWPKGDGWGGGGLFESENGILLNHRNDEMNLADGFQLPKNVKIKPLGNRPGWGEDSPIMDERLIRDGWKLTHKGGMHEYKSKAPVHFKIDPPMIWTKAHPWRKSCQLSALIYGFGERDGPWYVIEHSVDQAKPKQHLTLGRSDWADWCRSGDLLFGKEGRLFRLGFPRDDNLPPMSNARMLVDMTNRKFGPTQSPEDAHTWD